MKNLMDEKWEDDSKKTEELINELSECREDERSAQNQAIQVIATAGAILSFIFGASSIVKEDADKIVLFLLSNLILCTAVGYITSMGISNVLRYHYIQSLEDKLSKVLPCYPAKNRFVHWMSFSSPVTTRNPFHLESKFTWMHYLCYAGSVVCALIFCIAISAFQYTKIKIHGKLDELGLVFSSIFQGFSLLVFFLSSIKAKDMFRYAGKVSVLKRQRRLNVLQNDEEKRVSLKKDILHVIFYFVYPKIKDIHKVFLLIWGFMTGIFLGNGGVSISINPEQFINLLILIVVFDFLTYQARYQWNDVRGLREDMEEKKEGRLPAALIGTHMAVAVSLVIIIIKILSAILISLIWRGRMRRVLLISILLIMVCSILYEAARTLQKVWATLFIVCLGYIIRFFSGLWAAWPDIWSVQFRNIMLSMSDALSALLNIWNADIKVITGDDFRAAVILLLAAYGCYGAYSVFLPWTHEAIRQKNKGREIRKLHYCYLYNKIEDRHIDFTGGGQQPLRGKGKISDPWNIAYIISSVLLLAISFLCRAGIFTFMLELLFFGFSMKLCISSYSEVVYNVVVISGIAVSKAVVTVFAFGLYPFYFYICITQFVFAGTYLFLRYYFDPDFNFMDLCKKAAVGLYILVIGRDTWSYIKETADM